jgi:hypothetical protein
MDADQTARMRRLVWIHAGRKQLCWFCRDTAQLVIGTSIACKAKWNISGMEHPRYETETWISDPNKMFE